MSRNYELDRLKAEQQAAFERKQKAYHKYDEARQRTQRAHDIMQEAWQERSDARDEMNREYEKRQAAFEHNDAIWDEYKRIRDHNNYQLEYLRSDADAEHRAMIECFEQASAAYESGDKAGASLYSSEGHDHKDRRNELNAKVSSLVQEIKDAKAHAESAAPKVDSSAYNAAKARFEQAKQRHQAAQDNFNREREERNRLKGEFDRLQAVFLAAKEAFQQKLAEVKAEREARRNELHNGTYRGTYMGMPAVIKVSDAGNSDQVQVFYGGKGRPDGEGHSHINMVKDELRYWRENGTVIFDRHDSVNNL